MRRTLWIPAHAQGLGYLLAHNPWSASRSDPLSLSLRITSNDRAMTFPLTLHPGESWIIGRSRYADISIDDPTLSRRHLRITRRYHDFIVEDLGSRNGTSLGVCALVAGGQLTGGRTITAGGVRIKSTGPWERDDTPKRRAMGMRSVLERVLYGVLGITITWWILVRLS